jgi:hypothetical protein
VKYLLSAPVLTLSWLGLLCGCGASPPPKDAGTGGSVGTGGTTTGAGGSGGAVAAGGASSGGVAAGGAATGGVAMGGATTGGANSGPHTGAATGLPCGILLYDGEPGGVTLAQGQTWSDPRDDACMAQFGTKCFTETTDNPHSGTTALKIDLDWVDGAYGGDYGWVFGNYNSATAKDGSAATELSLWIRADHQTGGFNFWLTDSNKVSSTFATGQTAGTEWKNITIPMSTFAKDGWDITHLDFLGSDMHDDGQGSVIWWLDDIVLVGPVCD